MTLSRNPILAALLLTAAPAIAPAAVAVRAPDAEMVAASAYARARAADVLGDIDASATGYATALALAPGDLTLGSRAYRQALAAGDAKLALQAAHLLDGAGRLPPDGRFLLLTEAVQARNWASANAIADKIAADGIFAFMAPVMRGWIALGSRQGDPVAAIDAPVLINPAAPTDPAGKIAASPYTAEHRALLLIASGRGDEGVAALRALLGTAEGGSARTRLLVAAGLQRERKRDDALTVLAGEDPVLVAARAAIDRGEKLPFPTTAADGLAELFVRVAMDVDRQRVTPLALGFARLATILAPRNDAAWLTTASVLSGGTRPEAALAALKNVSSDGLLADPARTARLRLLVDRDQKAAALAEVQAAAARPDATAADWTHAGDLYQQLERYPEAVDAYGRALALIEQAGAGADERWQLLFMKGNAQDKAKDWAGAKASLTQALALAPEQPLILNYLGYAQLERRENMAEAQALIEKASKLRPDDPNITDSLGWAYHLTGDKTRAIATLERAAEGDPGQTTINEHLGDAYWSAGRRYEARYAWRAALIAAEATDARRIEEKIDAGLSERTAAP